MQKRGMINIDFANYLEADTDLFKSIYKDKTDMYHIIIGRWYYGVYLLAKSKLNCSNEEDVPHTTYTKDKLGIWERIAIKSGHPRASVILKEKGEGLYRDRNKYEYTGRRIDNVTLEEIRKNFMEVYNALQKIRL